MLRPTHIKCAIALVATVFSLSPPLRAQDLEDGAWRIMKTSGDAWVATSEVQAAALNGKEVLKPGDSIRTGRSGRVLLARGKETILIAPNSVVGLPGKGGEGATTILQQAGSILLEVEKRDVRNFEVETPYLVAAVKGTRFKVSVNRNDATVQVLKGSVEVADFKSGQSVLVHPGQTAKVAGEGQDGLSLSGSGVLDAVQHREPHASRVQHVSVPDSGLAAPNDLATGQHVHTLGVTTSLQNRTSNGKSIGRSSKRTLRIPVRLGEVNVNIPEVTKGLAHGTANSSSSGRGADARSDGSGSVSDAAAGANDRGNTGSSGDAGGNGGGDGAGNGNANAGSNAIGNGGSPPALYTGNGKVLGLGNGNASGNGKARGKP
jgi:hypothetical protein